MIIKPCQLLIWIKSITIDLSQSFIFSPSVLFYYIFILSISLSLPHYLSLFSICFFSFPLFLILWLIIFIFPSLSRSLSGLLSLHQTFSEFFLSLFSPLLFSPHLTFPLSLYHSHFFNYLSKTILLTKMLSFINKVSEATIVK
jgi:hypothetical protein